MTEHRRALEAIASRVYWHHEAEVKDIQQLVDYAAKNDVPFKTVEEILKKAGYKKDFLDFNGIRLVLKQKQRRKRT